MKPSRVVQTCKGSGRCLAAQEAAASGRVSREPSTGLLGSLSNVSLAGTSPPLPLVHAVHGIMPTQAVAPLSSGKPDTTGGDPDLEAQQREAQSLLADAVHASGTL